MNKIQIKRIVAYYFSPTGATLRATRMIAEAIGNRFNVPIDYHSYTLPLERNEYPKIEKDRLLIWSTPTYAGRIPNKTLDYLLKALQIEDIPCIAMCTYGNRHYDNCLSELVSLLRRGGGIPIAGAAIVTRHSFSTILAKGRPNDTDKEMVESFAEKVVTKIKSRILDEVTVPGDPAPNIYYTPLREEGIPASILKVKPECDESDCIRCGKCVKVCPMGSIDQINGIPNFNGICIKCHACVRYCPEQAIRFTNSDLLSHIKMLENNYSTPKDPEFFI